MKIFQASSANFVCYCQDYHPLRSCTQLGPKTHLIRHKFEDHRIFHDPPLKNISSILPKNQVCTEAPSFMEMWFRTEIETRSNRQEAIQREHPSAKI